MKQTYLELLNGQESAKMDIEKNRKESSLKVSSSSNICLSDKSILEWLPTYLPRVKLFFAASSVFG